MGQGAESCGGYDVEYDEYDEGLSSGRWTMRDGSSIAVVDMTVKHLLGARRVAERAAERATFSSDVDKWREWIEVFDDELARRNTVKPAVIYNTPSATRPTRGSKVTMICHCGTQYEARTADIARGWGLSCSKRCASIRREHT